HPTADWTDRAAARLRADSLTERSGEKVPPRHYTITELLLCCPTQAGGLRWDGLARDCLGDGIAGSAAGPGLWSPAAFAAWRRLVRHEASQKHGQRPPRFSQGPSDAEDAEDEPCRQATHRHR